MSEQKDVLLIEDEEPTTDEEYMNSLEFNKWLVAMKSKWIPCMKTKYGL